MIEPTQKTTLSATLSTTMTGKKRGRGMVESSDSEDSGRTRVPCVSRAVKRQARELLEWIRTPYTAEDYRLDPLGTFVDVLESISRLQDSRDSRNPRVLLEHEFEVPSGEIARKSGSMKLSQFLTLYATRQEHDFPLETYPHGSSTRYRCRFRNVSIYDGSEYRCRHLEGDEFRWERILEKVGRENADEWMGLEDLEVLMRWKILVPRSPFDPDDLPTHTLRAEADELCEDYLRRRRLVLRGFSCDRDSELEVDLELVPETVEEAEEEEKEDFALAEAWWMETDALLEQRESLLKQHDILAGKRR